MRLPNIVYNFFRQDRVKPTKYPRHIDLGLTNWCNLNCSMCPNDKITRPKGYMDEKLFRSIVDCIHDKFKCESVLGLGLYGESTLHPKFVDFLNYANSRGIKMEIACNFSFINDEIIKAIVKSQMKPVEISFYTLKKDDYNKLVGHDKYIKTLENIHKFLQVASEENFTGKVRLRPFKEDELSAYKKEFYDKYPKIDFQYQEEKKIENWTGFLKIARSNNFYVHKTCPSIFSRIAIDWDGEIRLCCKAMIADDLFLGYVDENYSIYDLWNSQEIELVRKRFNDLDYSAYPSCLKCFDTKKYISFSDIKKIFKK